MNLLRLELMTRMSLTLLQIQKTEQVLRLSSTYFMLKPGTTRAMISTEEKEERKRTLGYFIKKIRKRVRVDAEFVKVMDRFLTNRNTFAHEFLSVPGFDLSTADGLQVGIAFVDKLSDDAVHVRNVVLGYTRQVVRALGGEAMKLDENDEFYDTVALLAMHPK